MIAFNLRATLVMYGWFGVCVCVLESETHRQTDRQTERDSWDMFSYKYRLMCIILCE